MKKFIWFVFASLALTVASCSYDDSALKKDISDLQDRVSDLELKVKALSETTIPGIQTSVNNLTAKVYVDEVKSLEDGYTIIFSDGTSATIKDGVIGEDGHAPVVGVTLVEGVYCWTIDGEIVKGEDGNAIPVQGEAPQFRVVDGGLEVSFDGVSWDPVSVTGNPIVVKVDPQASTCIITLSDGSEIVLPVEKSFSISLDASEAASMPGVPAYIYYTVEGAAEGEDILVDALPSAGITATVTKASSNTGVISAVTADANVSGKVFVFAANGKGKADVKVIAFEGGKFDGVLNAVSTEAEGGVLTLNVKTNLDYEVIIPEDAQSWVSVLETKAMREETVTLQIEENTTASYRATTVTVEANDEVVTTYDIFQFPVKGETTDLASIAEVAEGSTIRVEKATVVAAGAQSAVLIDGVNGIYALGEGFQVGDVVSFSGKKSSEGGPVAVIVESAITVEADVEPAEDLGWSYFALSGIADTAVYGWLEYDDQLDAYGVKTAYTYVLLDVPAAGIDLAPYVGKLVNIPGYTYYGTTDYVAMVANGVSEIVVEEADWDVTYDGVDADGYDNFTVSAGAEEYWTIALFDGTTVWDQVNPATEEPFQSIDELVDYSLFTGNDDFQFSSFAWYMMLYGYDFETLFNIFVHSGEDSDYFEALPYGKHIAIAYGLDENLVITGKYKVLEFEKVDPAVPAAYSDFFGKWQFGSDVLDIAADAENQTYKVNCGIQAASYSGVEALTFYFDAEAGYMYAVEGELGEFDSNTVFGATYGMCTENLTGIFSYGTSTYMAYPFNTDTPKVLFSVKKYDDGSLHVIPGECDYGPFVGMAISWVIQSGDNAGKGNKGTVITFPEELLPAEEASDEYAAWVGSYTIERMDGKELNEEVVDTWRIEAGINNQTFTIYGIESIPDNYDMQVTANYDPATNTATIEAAALGQWTSQGQTVTDYIVGMYVDAESGDTYLDPTAGKTIVTLSKNEDGSIALTPAEQAEGNPYIGIAYMQYVGGSWYSYNYGYTTLPGVLTPAESGTSSFQGYGAKKISGKAAQAEKALTTSQPVVARRIAAPAVSSTVAKPGHKARTIRTSEREMLVK